MGRLITTTGDKYWGRKKSEAPVELFLQVWRAFLMGFWKKWGVERGFLMVSLWWDCGESWYENAPFRCLKNMPLYADLFSSGRN
jgi:hypothetical protein